jgi:hypothetical protein
VNQVNGMDRVFGTYGRRERCTQRFGGGAEGMRMLERIMSRWEDNIKMNIYVLGCGVEEWPGLIWLRIDRDGLFLNIIMNIRVP